MLVAAGVQGGQQGRPPVDITERLQEFLGWEWDVGGLQSVVCRVCMWLQAPRLFWFVLCHGCT